MKKLKHIGIAAITAEGASLAYRLICQEAQKILGDRIHPEITLHSYSFSEYFKDSENRIGSWSDLLLSSSRKLSNSGADFFICPSNSNHEIYDLIQAQLPIPWLHIAEAVLEEVKARNFKKVALLGTIYTMNSDIYSKYFNKQGIEICTPNAQTQEEIQRIIYKELIRGIFLESSKRYLVDLILELKHRGSEGVILGCTELPLIINEQDVEAILFDSTAILALAAVKRALS